jgi:class 3 adenylate cyclase
VAPGLPDGYLTALHAGWLANAPDRRFERLEGTLLFADVSGFTKLGERLARKGNVGAEELTEAVNAVFAGMLAEVSARGGEILKFGGDAVLSLFRGREHPLQGIDNTEIIDTIHARRTPMILVHSSLRL